MTFSAKSLDPKLVMTRLWVSIGTRGTYRLMSGRHSGVYMIQINPTTKFVALDTWQRPPLSVIFFRPLLNRIPRPPMATLAGIGAPKVAVPLPPDEEQITTSLDHLESEDGSTVTLTIHALRFPTVERPWSLRLTFLESPLQPRIIFLASPKF